MSSPERRTNPSYPPPDGSRSKRVTFASTGTSILILSDDIPISQKNGKDRMRALRSRRATPRREHPTRDHITSSPSSRPSESASAGGGGGGETDTHREKRMPRLVESGAVRVQIAKHTNLRRGDKHGISDRLIDSGAVRLNVTRHTTPRRLYATHSRIWSPPPPSSSTMVRVPLCERIPGRGTATINTPSRRTNARVGGHKFLAALSPKYSTPVIRTVTYEKKEERNLDLESEGGLPRTLFN